VLQPPEVLECRALLELYHDLRCEHTALIQRIHAVLLHQRAAKLGEGGLSEESCYRGSTTLTEEIIAAQLSAAGQAQVMEGQLRSSCP